MPLAEDRSQAPLTFQVVGLDADRFQVVRFRGTEGLCQLYRFEIDLVSSDTSIALNDIVGKDVVESAGGSVHAIEFLPNRSTSKIIQKIIQTAALKPK